MISGARLRTSGYACLDSSIRTLLPLLLSLDLSYNKLGYQGALRFKKGLESCTELQFLDISGNDLSLDSFSLLLPAFKRLKKMKNLRLSGNSIGPEGAIGLADGVLAEMPLLTSLEIARCCLKGAGVLSLGPALREHSLELLYMDTNQIGMGALDGCQALNEMLHPSLRALHLSHNRYSLSHHTLHPTTSSLTKSETSLILSLQATSTRSHNHPPSSSRNAPSRLS